MEKKNFDNKFNICIVGNNNVGKSSYIKRLTEDKFVNSYKKTSGIETYQIPKLLKGKNFLFKIWDISGTTKPHNISNDLYRTVDGFIFTFALNDAKSYEDIIDWIDAIIVKKTALEKCIVLCLKSDLDSEIKVDLNQVRKTCEEYEIVLYEVSAKTNKNVADSFEILVRKILYRNSASTACSTQIMTLESNSNSGCAVF